MRRMLFAAVLLAAAAPVAAAAQATPEQVVTTYFGHLARGEMRQAARLTHPEALNAFRDGVARIHADRGHWDYTQDVFRSAQDIRRLPADSVLAVALRQFEDQEEMLQSVRVQPLGHVMHGDTAFVMVQASMGPEDDMIRYPIVIPLRRDGAQWKVDAGRSLVDVLGGGVLYLLGIYELREDLGEG